MSRQELPGQMDIFEAITSADVDERLQARLRDWCERDHELTAALLDLPEDHPLSVLRRQLEEAYGPRTGLFQSYGCLSAWLRGEWIPVSMRPICEASPWFTGYAERTES